MTDASPLSVAFIERYPSAAARVLENLEIDDATALINVLPGNAIALALGRMTPFIAAQFLIQIDVDRAAYILQTMMFLDAASILRVIKDDNREIILDALPKDLVRDFKISLNHPPASVGAWMDQRISPLPLSHTVSEALKYAKQKKRPEGDELFVVDDAGRFIGVIRISQLIQNDGKAVLRDLVQTDPPTISNRATLSSVLNLPDWDDHTILAVVGRKGNFLGTLSRNLVRRGIVAAGQHSVGLASNSILSHLLSGCFITFVGLLGLIFQSAEMRNSRSESEVRHDG